MRRHQFPIAALIAAAVLCGLVGWFVGHAIDSHAAPPFSGTFGTAGIAAPAGTLVPLGTVAIPADLQHRDCTVAIHMQNNESVHVGSMLRVTTDGSTWHIPDVEAVAGAGQDYAMSMRLGTAVVFSGVAGTDPDPTHPDGFSGRGSFTLECQDPPTTVPPTTQPPVVTTVPVATAPPVVAQAAPDPPPVTIPPSAASVACTTCTPTQTG